MALPESIQKAADYADSVEADLTRPEQTEDAPDHVVDTTQEVQGEVDEAEKLRNRYASLRGKYDAEVPRLHHRNKELEERIEELTRANEELRGEIASREEKTPYLTESDVESYGEDMVDLVRRGAREESAKYAKSAAELRSRLDHLQREIESQARDSVTAKHSAFVRQLTQEYPEWETQNTDQGFLDWLEGVDSVYGFQRNEALQRAYRAMDANAVARIFKQYKTEKGSNPLARQVAPSRVHARQVSNGGQNVWTQQMIANFYDAWRRGDVPDDQAEQIAREIDQAVASGQVTE